MSNEQQDLKTHIISEIRRLAGNANGIPPGSNTFERATGIAREKWRGRFWAKWSDAITEAGHIPNQVNASVSENAVLDALVAAVSTFGHFPTNAELKLFLRNSPSLPSMVTIAKRLPTKRDMVLALKKYALSTQLDSRIVTSIEKAEAVLGVETKSVERETIGWVYLLQSGLHYKIGRSETIERRIKSISISLPEAVKLVHAIQTDDSVGIEKYWHERFSSKRANGEWFSLATTDIAAFKKRKFM